MSASNINPDFYEPAEPEWWSGRVDSETDKTQFRFHQVIKCIPVDTLNSLPQTVLLGFASDEGVKRNSGREGAAEGPQVFRKMISSLCLNPSKKEYVDVGNIFPKNGDLETAQNELGKAVAQLLALGKKPFVIGGGHETAFGHYVGIASFLAKNSPLVKLGILNIDAHFDLRPHHGIPHSGSPFLQAFEHAKAKNIDLGYFLYGINRYNNTASLFDKAKELEVKWIENQEIIRDQNQSLEQLRQFVGERDLIYLTVCMDVFNAATAPGVSAPAWNGIELTHALDVLELVKASKKLISMDVCELNPRYDQDGRTARLAGSLFAEYCE